MQTLEQEVQSAQQAAASWPMPNRPYTYDSTLQTSLLVSYISQVYVMGFSDNMIVRYWRDEVVLFLVSGEMVESPAPPSVVNRMRELSHGNFKPASNPVFASTITLTNQRL